MIHGSCSHLDACKILVQQESCRRSARVASAPFEALKIDLPPLFAA